MKKINIAIDGLAGCGKSTTAKLLAKSLGYIYIDTGAMYRAVTLYLLRNEVPIHDQQAVTQALGYISIALHPNADGTLKVLLNSEDVSDAIRSKAVNGQVSQVSAIKSVREFLVAQQQQIGKNKGVVMDGRDIGTVVFPDAELKIFMTASAGARAQRRLLEMHEKGVEADLAAVEANLRERDKIDSERAESPLKKAEDARELDTSNISIAQQLQTVTAWAKEKIKD